ncbi:MAG: hypothetical protein ACP5J4_18735 [Anaerolineae bacterium]
MTEYVIKHTWGWQNFSTPVRLAWHDFQYGRRTGTRNLDHGTGLSRRALRHALEDAQAWGLLEHPRDAAGQPTYTYRPRMLPPDLDTPAALADEAAGAEWHGFTPPHSNFFKVPALWTDMSTRLSSEVAILSVEYLFRHTWGWETWDGRACWLTEDEIAHGRRYANREQRYDTGIGYSTRAVHDGLHEALSQGLLVWREEAGERQYALYLQGMLVSDAGEFCGWPTSTASALSPYAPTLDTPVAPQHPQGTAPAAVPSQIVELTQHITALLEVLAAAGITLPPNFGAEASTPRLETSKLPSEESRPPAEESTPPYIQTLIDTPKTLTSSDTHVPRAPCKDDAKTGDGAEVALPGDIQRALAQIGFHRTRKALHEVQAVYAEDPAYVKQWLQHLTHTRAGDPRAAGFFRQAVLRERVPLPGTGREPGRTNCPECHGAGVVLDDRGERAMRCPVCQSREK